MNRSPTKHVTIAVEYAARTPPSWARRRLRRRRPPRRRAKQSSQRLDLGREAVRMYAEYRPCGRSGQGRPGRPRRLTARGGPPTSGSHAGPQPATSGFQPAPVGTARLAACVGLDWSIDRAKPAVPSSRGHNRSFFWSPFQANGRDRHERWTGTGRPRADTPGTGQPLSIQRGVHARVSERPRRNVEPRVLADGVALAGRTEN